MKKIIGLGILFAVSVSLTLAATTLTPQAKKPKYNLEGIVTQINQGDGSFNIRLRDGKNVTIVNPFQPGTFLGINADISRLNVATSVTNLSQVVFMDANGPDAIPAITAISPGLVSIGDTMVISGGPFMKTGNDVFISGPVSGFMKNLMSFDGKTVPIKIPAKLCTSIQNNKCTAYAKPTEGEYEISITNANGLSNTTKFNIKDLPPLTLTTDKLAQPTQGVRYAAPLTATGGTDSYAWKVSSGVLPDGLKLVVPVCVASPCRVPATISGIPKTSGIYTFSISLTSGDEKVSQQFTMNIIQAINTNYYSGTAN